MIFKCKMCGGALEVQSNATVAECEYCGTTQTLPRLDDERRANLYDRANHFRRNNEFDKAAGIYEQILTEDKTDAEAYWSLVLCRYGIEYVEDPATHKRIPTVNRAQFTAIFDDDNYKAALQYADGGQRSIYEAEARAINEIQKGILAISQQEEPFDVFICYKETDANGRRTPDSVLANDLYHQLTQEGFKVFFARITLEDKLGQEYEPYIFAALNSARVMVVLGTKPEHFSAVWVRNEWSRYLALIRSGAKKILIPAYKDMDPYDLPEEFSHLQAQDMGKLGFMQDLIRGIKKLAQAEAPKAVIRENIVQQSSNVTALLKRGSLALEDGEWSKADGFYEEVLNQEAECAEAYLGKLMAELQVRKQDALRDCAESFDSLNNYKKALRFANEELRASLTGCIEYINTRNENARLSGIYERAKKTMLDAKTEYAYKEAAKLFDSIPDYKDAAALAAECREMAEVAGKDATLEAGKRTMTRTGDTTGETIRNYQAAIKLFKTIPGWKDADESAYECERKIAEVKVKMEKDRIERERRIEAVRKEAERKAKRDQKIAAVVLAVLLLAAAVYFAYTNILVPAKDYEEAETLFAAGDYNGAAAAFEALGDYKDAAERVEEVKAAKLEAEYNDAVALMNAGNIIEAYDAFMALNGHKDSTEKAESIYDTYKDEKFKNIKVGSTIFFGAYEQDNNTSNGKEDIEWIVLEIKENKAFLVSKYILNHRPYHTEVENITWEHSLLRRWLNNDFFNSSFSEEEKEKIPTVKVIADITSQNKKKGPGNDTQDKVFLLSVTEARSYLKSNDARICETTNYAVAQANAYGEWWLRTQGGFQSGAATVDSTGEISYYGIPYTYEDKCGVRPAMWIDLSED